MRRARAFGCDKSISSKPKSAPIKRIRHRRGGLVAPSNVTGALPRARQRTDGAGADPAARRCGSLTRRWSRTVLLKPEFVASQFNFSRLSDSANYGRAGHGSCQGISHESKAASVGSATINPMTPLCPVCEKPMKEHGRAFQCEPSRQIIIFFAVSDVSPYVAAGRVLPKKQ